MVISSAVMRTAILIASTLFALASPLRPLLLIYLRVFLLNTVILEMLLYLPPYGQWSHVYSGVYWFSFALNNALMGMVIWTYEWRMLTDPILRVFAAGWALIALFYLRYFMWPEETGLDWLPSAIFASAFIFAGARARLERAKEHREVTV